MKILWVSRLGFTCSFHQVTASLYHGFKSINPGYEFYFQTVNISPNRETIDKFCSDFNISPDHFYHTLVNYDMSTEEDIHFETLALYGYTSIVSTIKEVNPKLVIILDDTALIKKLSDRLKKAFEKQEIYRNFKLVAYVPIDHENNSTFALDCIYDIYLTPSYYGYYQLKPYVNSIYVLPHAVTTDSLLKINQNKFKGHKYEVEELRILSINTPHVRKRWDLVLETYFKFVQLYQKPSRLIIKTNKVKEDKASLSPIAQHDIQNLFNLLSQKYQTNRVIIELIEDNLSREELIALQLSSHLGLYMSSGEGFGMTPLESASLGIPQIIPDNTSFKELFPYYPYRVKTEKVSLYQGRVNFDNLLDSYICIFKSYLYDEVGLIRKPLLSISNIPTYLIDTHLRDVKYGDKLIKPIKLISLGDASSSPGHPRNLPLTGESSSASLPARYQIIININPDFLRSLNWSLYPECFTHSNRYELYLDSEKIRRIYSFEYGSVDIPIVEDAVDKLLFLANNIKERERAGIMCKHYASKYTQENVANNFKNILHKMLPILPPVVIFSHERSGCHMLINSLVDSFDYDKEWIDIDNLSLPLKFESGRIYKCHHVYQHIKDYDFNQCCLVLLKRDKVATLISYRKFLYLLSFNEGPKLENEGEFFITRTQGFQERYQIKSNITQEERYDQFYQSYSESPLKLVRINYEDLRDSFQDEIIKLNLKKYFQPSPSQRTIL